MFLDGLFSLLKKRPKEKKEKSGASAGPIELSLDEIDGMDLEEFFGPEDDDNESEKKHENDENIEEARAEEKNEGGEESSAPLNSQDDSMDIDQEIEALLKRDVSLDDTDLNLDYVQHVDVHENRESFADYVTDVSTKGKGAEKIAVFIEGVPMKTMYIVAGIMGFLIVIMVAMGFFFLALNSNARQGELQSKGLLSQPAYVSNNANFIYLNRLADFHEEELVLIKMLIDPTATLFYFQQSLDVANLDFVLEDEKGTLYSMDLTYAEYGQEEQDGGTVLRFEPIDLSVLSYVLTISDRSQSCQFPFKLDKGMIMPPVKYLNTPIDTLVNVPGLSLAVTGGTLSSSGSVVYYKLQWDDPFMKIQMGEKGYEGVVGMTESGRTVLPAKSHPLLYEFADDYSILGRMDFEAVKSLSGILRITFKDLYKKIQVNAELQTGGLFTNTDEGQQIYRVGNYDVVLERMGWQGDNIVLVFHTENRDLFAKSGENVEGAYSGRVECRLDAQMLIKTASGMEITLEGKSMSGQKGTDMLFNAAMAKSLMQDGDITLKINSVLVKMDPVTAEYDLDRAGIKQDSITAGALSAVSEAFKKRLAYKSGELAAEDITGFTDGVLADERLMSNYETVSGVQSPSYAVRFVTYSISGDKMQGVVQEQWKANADGKEARFYRTHRIWAKVDEMGWNVVRDEIIM